jgi:hypothetical protein
MSGFGRCCNDTLGFMVMEHGFAERSSRCSRVLASELGFNLDLTLSGTAARERGPAINFHAFINPVPRW